MPSARKLTKNRRSDTIPYAPGFKPPSSRSRYKAAGIHLRQTESKYLTASESFFAGIPKPSSIDDWLAKYNVKGQPFAKFLNQTPWLSKKTVKDVKHTFIPDGETLPEKYPDGKIYVIQLGNFSKEHLHLDDLLEYTRIFFDLPVVLLDAVTIKQTRDQVSWIESGGPEKRAKQHRLKSRYNYKTKRIQIRVDSLLQSLRTAIPDDAICMMGLTMYDLYGDDTDLFVAGMAAGRNRVGVFSLFRYDPHLTFSPEHWYDISKENSVAKQDDNQLLLRSCRLLVHEICHLLGIAHCIYFACCMNGSGHLEEDFRQPMFLCPVDLHKLEVICGFNVLNRYQKMNQFFIKHKMREEADWVTRRINFITS